ncbi:MAG: histidine--tRNA ligase [bacterium]|nr:histidine--tRNA ligase [bacterium]
MAIRCARGTRDIMSAEIPYWHHFENAVFNLASIHGFKEIRTPIFESPDLYTKGLGSNAERVERELWTLKDKNGKKLALRADMTASTVRAFHEHGLADSIDPHKFYYLGPVFLQGKGRDGDSRQVSQFGLEALGSEDPAIDTEIIAVVYELCMNLGLKDIVVQLNTLGCPKCREEYQQVLRDYFTGRQDEMCSNCKRRYREHPLWTLACTDPACSKLVNVAPTIYGFLCSECRDHFETIKLYLKELNINYKINPMLVRDMEYYGRTIFEIDYDGMALALGGRYDALSELIGGRATPAVGCSMDVEQMITRLYDLGMRVDPYDDVPIVCLAGGGRDSVLLLLPVLYALRRAGVAASLAYRNGDDTLLDASLRSKARYIICLEECDAHQRIVSWHDAEHGSSKEMRLEDAVSRLGRTLGVEHLASELRPAESHRVHVNRRGSKSRGRVICGCDVPKLSKSMSQLVEEKPAAEPVEPHRHRRRRSSEKSAAASAAVEDNGVQLADYGNDSIPADDIEMFADEETVVMPAVPEEDAASPRKRRRRSRRCRERENSLEMAAVAEHEGEIAAHKEPELPAEEEPGADYAYLYKHDDFDKEEAAVAAAEHARFHADMEAGMEPGDADADECAGSEESCGHDESIEPVRRAWRDECSGDGKVKDQAAAPSRRGRRSRSGKRSSSRQSERSYDHDDARGSAVSDSYYDGEGDYYGYYDSASSGYDGYGYGSYAGYDYSGKNYDDGYETDGQYGDDRAYGESGRKSRSSSRRSSRRSGHADDYSDKEYMASYDSYGHYDDYCSSGHDLGYDGMGGAYSSASQDYYDDYDALNASGRDYDNAAAGADSASAPGRAGTRKRKSTRRSRASK